MPQELSEVVLILVGSTLIILALISLVVLALFISQKRKFRHKQEIVNLKNTYEQEVLKTQLEAQTQTFETISQELHDNVGTLVSMAMVHLKSNQSAYNQEAQETNKLLDEALDLLRDISRSINPDNIRKRGLEQSLRNELERVKRIKFIKTDYSITGKEFSIEPAKQIIFFRIVQEALNNVIKHSGGDSVNVQIIFNDPSVELTIKDNGKGFLYLPENGDFVNKSGLLNMKKRAKMINAALLIQSEINKGTEIKLSYPA